MLPILPRAASLFVRGRPRRAVTGDVRSLIEARRFVDARAAIKPDDAQLRAELAIAQRGPQDALEAAAADMSMARAVRRAARHVLHLDYPTTRVTVPLWENPRDDRVTMVVHLAQRARAQRAYAREASLMVRLATFYPEADERPQWLWRAAAAAAMAGDDVRAKSLATDLPDAQGLVRALEGVAAPVSPRHLNAGRNSVAARALDPRDLRDGYMSFRTVSDALAMTVPPDVVVEVTSPDLGTAAAVLDSGGVVVIHLVAPESGAPVFLPVYALRPDAGIAHVGADGYVLWNELPWVAAVTERMVGFSAAPTSA